MSVSITRLVSPRNALILLGALAVCLVTGSFVDYQLSNALFNLENPFGLLFAAYGQFPTAAASSVAGVLFICTFDRTKMVSSVLLALLGVILNAFGLLMAVYEPTSYLPLSVPVAVAIGVVLLVLVNAAVLTALRGTSNRQLRKYGAFLAVLVLAQTIIINVIKIPWGRPRMRMIAITEGASFQPWWIIGSDQKDALMAAGVVAEEFKSFPSGHTASAACAMALVALPAVKPALARWSNALFWGSALVPAVVAFSRIIMGAHFLTDVTMGFTTTFLILLVLLYAFWGNKVPEQEDAA